MNSLNIYKLKQKIVAYVKDEGFNLNIMTTTLKSIVSCDVFSLENIMITTLKSVVSCDVFSLEKKIQGACFGHAFSKACQYVIAYEKVRKGLRYVSTKVAF
jgi:hypothetical protein